MYVLTQGRGAGHAGVYDQPEGGLSQAPGRGGQLQAPQPGPVQEGGGQAGLHDAGRRQQPRCGPRPRRADQQGGRKL